MVEPLPHLRRLTAAGAVPKVKEPETVSRITELAEAEAQAAEAEDTTSPAEPEPHPDDEAEPEDEAEAVAELPAIDTRALERALKAHEKAMAKVLGEGFGDLVPCAACEGVGYTPPNMTPQPELCHDPMTETCNACNGYGQVLTGALADAQPLRPCTSCQGGGYTTKALTATLSAPAIDFTANGATGGDAASTTVVIDPAEIERLRAAGFTIIEPYRGG